MKIDFISIFTIVYIILTAWAFMLYYKKANKNYITTVISGLVLLGYSTYLYMTSSLEGHWYVLILSVAMLQLAAFEAGSINGKVNWSHHLIRLIVHCVIVYFMIF